MPGFLASANSRADPLEQLAHSGCDERNVQFLDAEPALGDGLVIFESDNDDSCSIFSRPDGLDLVVMACHICGAQHEITKHRADAMAFSHMPFRCSLARAGGCVSRLQRQG